MKTRRKGNRHRRELIKQLEAQGFIVDVVEKTGRFIKQKDLFGLFDLIALRAGETHLIQVSTNIPHTHKNLMEFKKAYPYVFIDQYVWIDHKGFTKYEYTPEGWTNDKN